MVHTRERLLNARVADCIVAIQRLLGQEGVEKGLTMLARAKVTLLADRGLPVPCSEMSLAGAGFRYQVRRRSTCQVSNSLQGTSPAFRDTHQRVDSRKCDNLEESGSIGVFAFRLNSAKSVSPGIRGINKNGMNLFPL